MKANLGNLLGLLWLGSLSLSAQISVSVDASNVRSDVTDKPWGINTNTYTDGDGNRDAGVRPLRDALSDTPLNNYLRFPGGGKKRRIQMGFGTLRRPHYFRPRPHRSRK